MNPMIVFLTAVAQKKDYSFSQLITDVGFAILYLVAMLIVAFILVFLYKVYKKIK